MTQSVGAFLDALGNEMPRCDAERLGAERYGSPRLSSFELLDPNENTLSKVIAEFLDPRGAHGQGPLFLNALLRSIGAPVVHLRDPVRITREFMTKHRRRIDILIETPSVLVGVENKPFAAQGENQLSDYHEDLRDRAGKRTPHLVFLSDSDPMTAGDVARIVRFYDFGEDLPSLCGMLDAVKDEIRSPRARAFVDDFREWIARHFGGEDMTDELEPYAQEVLTRFDASRDSKAIGAVMLAGERIRCNVIDRIGQHIWSVLSETYPDIVQDEEPLSECIKSRYYAWEINRPSWPTNCCLGIEADSKGANGIYYGVVALKPKSKTAKDNLDDVCIERDGIETSAGNVPGGSRSDSWAWWQYAPSPNWSTEFVARLLIESDGRIEDHDDVRKITADMVLLAEAIEARLQSDS